MEGANNGIEAKLPLKRANERLKNRWKWELSYVPDIPQTGGKERKFMQTMEKVSKNISLIISLFPHLVNALWRGRGTKSIQDFGGGKKNGLDPKTSPILLKF